MKVKKKTVKRAMKAADKVLKKKLELKFDNEWVMQKIDEDGDYECGCGAPHSSDEYGVLIKELTRRIFTAPTPRQLNYAGHVQRMVRLGECGDLTNYFYWSRLRREWDALIGDMRHWWSL